MRRGFDGDLEGDPGMAMDLNDLNEDAPTQTNLNIVQAIEQKTLEDWKDAFAEAFEMPVSGGQAWVDATLSAGLENAPWQIYVGYLDGKPVASSILFLGAGVAGVHGVGTIPEARNQGIGTAMTLKPLRVAREQGYHFAVLFSSRMGYPVYKRLGFREVACKIGVYIKERDQGNVIDEITS
jgi:ribosomal protein S18 acetylase RimI-like enzyme